MALKRINKVSSRSEFAKYHYYTIFVRFPSSPHPRPAWCAVAAACARRWRRCPFASCPRDLLMGQISVGLLTFVPFERYLPLNRGPHTNICSRSLMNNRWLCGLVARYHSNASGSSFLMT